MSALRRAVPPGVTRRRLARELGLALLPALLSLGLLVVVTRPAYDALIQTGGGWKPHAYQGLAQDVLQYQVARLNPQERPARRTLLRDIALSSAQNPQQFVLLAEIERQGEARLGVVERALRLDTDASVAQAVAESLALNSAAAEYSRELGLRSAQALSDLRRTLGVAALLSGLVSVLLILRALLLWRGERLRVERREARQREALSLASHELRRPLQALMLASDLLRQAQTPEERQHLLAMIEDSAGQLASRADLTRLNDLYLDVTLRPQRRDLRELTDRFASARVQVLNPPDPVVWAVDPGRVRQMLENLIENALKYTDSHVEVTLDVHAGAPRIRVRDFGAGMGPEERARVFLPYERGPRGLTAGQGLGLPLVRRYARAHGGDISMTQAAGGGLLLTLTFGQPAPASEVSAPSS
ncbi:HAMP domain-containing histidine kinase [Deinococcus sp. HMF7604]|uniref:sensor histidine kinase n=1 Tax=Deinococcus betulae TaxID=2873312 RepID=UPI001CCA5142|nr:HAMP domain-containing histidine kinase [Deinococcus betulae]